MALAAPVALASAMTLALAPPALALATAGAQGGLRTAADGPNAPLRPDTTTTTPTTTTTTPTTPTTPTTTPTTPTQPSTTPTPSTTPYTQPTTVPYTPPTTTQATAPAAPLTTTTTAPPPVVHKPTPTLGYAPPRVRLTDLGVAQRGAAASGAAADPAPTTHRTRMIVLIATGFGLLLALGAASVLIVRQRRPAALPRRFEVDRERLSARRGFFRVNGDRIRVAFDERGADLLILGLGLAAAVALGALVAS